MIKNILLILVVLVSLTVFPARASGFNLQSIGGMDTTGKQISHWWYTGFRPTFKGEASPSAPVNVTIDGTALQVNADSSGSWLFTPTDQLGEGDHTVNLENNGSKIDFTLTLGANNVNMTAVEKGAGDALPASGTFEVTVAIIAISVVLMGFGMFGYGKILG
ncbi:hypothetical protein KBC75_02930 [Candidatus Shapirobacteria bacterium]|nr:hypothetical protein [Candidatus Shapirobacteria bacterium]